MKFDVTNREAVGIAVGFLAGAIIARQITKTRMVSQHRKQDDTRASKMFDRMNGVYDRLDEKYNQIIELDEEIHRLEDELSDVQEESETRRQEISELRKQLDALTSGQES